MNSAILKHAPGIWTGAEPKTENWKKGSHMERNPLKRGNPKNPIFKGTKTRTKIEIILL